MGNFKEANGTIRLPEQDPATFKYFVHWLYTGSLRGFYYSGSVNPTLKELTYKVRSEAISQKLLHADDLPVTNPHRKLWEYANYRDLPFNSLIALYLLADKLQVPRLKDASITALVEVYGISSADQWNFKMFWMEDAPIEPKDEWKGINMAWETLPETSKLCQVLLHLFCDNTAGIDFEREREEDAHPDFVAATSRQFARRWLYNLPASDWTKPGAICSFHEHQGSSCDLTEKYLADLKAMGQ